jgi:hypothetical protein
MALSDATVDWVSDVRIFERKGDVSEVFFTGLVSTLTVEDDGLRLRLASRAMPLQEARLGGGGTLNVSPLEALASILRRQGLGESEMNIHGYQPGPVEAWEVTVPVDGLRLSARVRLGPVLLVPADSSVDLPPGLGPQTARDRFTGAAYIRAFVVAPTAFDAELRANREIDLALAWLTARSHYSTARLPDGGLFSYHRDRWRTLPSRRDALLAHGVVTHRYWLSTADIDERPPLVLSAESKMLAPEIKNLSAQDGEAIAAWRRAVHDPNPLAQVAALWEAAEFLVAGRSMPNLFSEVQLASLRAIALQGLDELQKSALLRALNSMNAPPLLKRLRYVAETDSVPVTEAEWNALSRIRRVRNEFTHGDSRDLPAAADLRIAISVVNRMLIYRVQERSVGGGGST